MTNGLESLTLGARPQGPTLLRARWIVGNVAGRHRLYENAELVFDGGEVVFVGHDFPGEVARRIDLGNVLVGPGFIDLDALSDLDTTVLGLDAQPGWKKGRVWPESYVARGPYEMYDGEELAFQKRYAFAQLLLNGITTAAPIASLFYREWGETVAEFDAAADAAGELGLRVYLGPGYRAGGMVVNEGGNLDAIFDEERGLERLAAALDFAARQDGRHGGLVRGLLAPDRVETCTERLLRDTARAAEERGLPIRLHAAQGAMEVETMKRLHGKTAPRWLADLEVLSPRLIAPHATHASDDDLELYRDHGVSIVHCPLVSARHGSALRSFGRCRAMGLNIAMGTDTAPPDMMMNMSMALMTARMVEGRADALSAADVYEAATLGGAKALGRDDIGRIAPSCRADFAVFDLANPRTGPAIDPIRTLIVAGTGAIVKATFVDGRLSMRDGHLAGIDLYEAQDRAQAQFDGLVAKYPDRTLGHPPVDEIFPPSFPLQHKESDDADAG
ncbi:amidohydrolase family protein [Mesorhizobium sp. YIM 152430]|uniref:amidohydrolase family protein n=1 Tax=Mesorhizobium sp. YIM 152430 TaxID=3031761 RepID=UPI0023DC0DBE|nr:amidohydrolase family protein [Mesorhizobium sp. YIM 152430]MDF1598959.1 amidohydrolase family protein [Mesorhizobium sp. YIM 152430]